MGKKLKAYQKEKNMTSKENEREEENLKEEILLMEEEEKEKGYLNEEEEINLTEELDKKTEKIKDDLLKYYSQKNIKYNWLENLSIISKEEVNKNLNPDDDIKRELIFYNIAKETAIEGLKNLKKFGEKINRPDDYFVEMLKSDEQMGNIKKQIS